MAQTRTAKELLVVALQDLNDAEHAVIERIPDFESDVSAELAALVKQERGRAAAQSERLEQALKALGKPATDAPNIWLRAVLDDAERDRETIAAGALRDIALVGAFRKGKQAERVSYETAIGLAHMLGETELEHSLQRCRDEEAAADDALALLLRELLAGVAAPAGA